MKNVFEYNYVIYRGNVGRDFYIYCLKKDIKLIRFILYNFVYYILSLLFKSKKDIYEKNRFKYLKSIKELKKEITNFYKTNRYNDILTDEVNIIIDKVPIILIPKHLAKRIIGYELDGDFCANIDLFRKKINSIKSSKKMYIRRSYGLNSISHQELFYVHNNNLKKIKNKFKISNNFKNICIIVFVSILLTVISFFFTTDFLNFSFLKSYFKPLLFLVNFIPIFLLATFLSILFKRVHISFAITSVAIMVLGIANQTKLIYRDDVVKFEDLTIVKEAMIMSTRYDIIVKRYTIAFIILLIALFFIIRRYFNKFIFNGKRHLSYIVLIILIFILSYRTIYMNNKIYDKLGDKGLINVWISTRQSQIRGLIYPFIYSINEFTDNPPNNYSEKVAKNALFNYVYDDIDSDKKVNIIAIMLEAYNDFSKFNAIDFDEDIYEKFHNIQSKSISGKLVTSIFGGGTIDTERKFLTGYNNSPNFRRKTNSYVWYFKEQGYKTEAMHPIYGAFYNRASVNINLGFDKYYYYENTFSKIKTEFLNDDDFFKQIILGYENAKKENVPYFNFSVTYQNHGPYYDLKYAGKEYYFSDNGYDAIAYNVINEYFSGIKSTNEALEKLINYFDDEESPTIIILFGDHNPYLGADNLAYNQLGINLDLSTVEGFENYYETPYIIHGNTAAKNLFTNDFIGEGNTISPIFLMNEVFNLMGESGNQYLQYMEDLKLKIDVISPIFYKEDNKFILSQKSNYKSLIDEYEMVDYYYSRNFVKVK